MMRALILAGLGFGADQISKSWALTHLSSEPWAAAPFLNFVLAFNTGVNFGLFAADSAAQRYILAGVAIAVSLGLLIWAARTRDGWVAAACGLVAGGALANAYDRIVLGAVVDFINMDCCGIGNPYAFNLADVVIFLGAAILIFCAWGGEDETDGGPGDDAPVDSGRAGS